MRIGIDMGHTLSGAGTSANGYVKESDKNREVGKRLIAMLQEKGHTVVNCTVDKSSNDLADRVAKANAQALDLFLSLHLNAYKMTTSEMGVETYSYSASGTSRNYAEKIQSELVSKVGWKNRGCKTANYYVLRNTKAPAVLTELGFCDSQADMNKWNTENIAKALFKGVTGAEYTTSAPTPAPPSKEDIMYRVVCGSYQDKDGAIGQQNKLKSAGFDSFLDAFKKDGKTFFRVICGSYQDRANADSAMAKVKAKGFDCFLAVYGDAQPQPTPPPAPTPTPSNDDKIIKEYAEKGYAIPRTTVNVRNQPSTNNTPVAKYSKGEKINAYDKVVITNAYTWISYVSKSGTRRYVAVRNRKTDERYVDCY